MENRDKYMITQRAPQGFKEAVDAIEEMVRGRQDGTSSKVEMHHFLSVLRLE